MFNLVPLASWLNPFQVFTEVKSSLKDNGNVNMLTKKPYTKKTGMGMMVGRKDTFHFFVIEPEWTFLFA